MKDGKVHYINNLGKVNGEGNYLYRFSFKGHVYTGSTGCPRYDDALTYLNKIKGDLALGTVGIKKKKLVTFGQAYQSWLKVCSPQLSANYIQNIKTRLEHHALPLIGGRVLDEVDRAVVAEVCNILIEKGGAKSSAHLLGLQIGTILTHAHEMKWITHRPKIKVIKPGQKKFRPVISRGNLDEFLLQVDARDDLDFSFMIRAMVYMGMRSDEVVKMKWLCYQPSTTTYIADVTKNNDAPSMPIPPLMMEWFEKLREERQKSGLLSTWICPSPRDSKKHRSANSCTSMLLQVAEKLELGRLTRHRLRASFATILHQAGVPIKKIQLLMRHKRVETTMTYIQVEGKELQEAVNKVFA